MNTIKILKYPVAPVVSLPRGARPLSVQLQPGPHGARLCLWALVVEGQPLVERRVTLVQTGEVIPAEVAERFDHVETVQALVGRPNGAKSIVTHVMVEREATN